MGKRGMTIAEVAEKVCADYDTVHRWIRVGFKGIRLNATRYGRSWSVSEAELERFQQACRADAIIEEVDERKRKNPRRSGGKDRQRRIDECKKRLEAMGV